VSDAPLDVGRVLEHLHELSGRFSRAHADGHLVIELGRYLIGEAGIYVCRVIERKISRGQVFLIVDGGMHQHLAASGNFGQPTRKNFPTLVNGKLLPREVASVVGPLCTPLDLLADRSELAHAVEGDLIVILQSGAYGRTASPRAFLGHPDVCEALV
jgi:diaminopimelate decarboxylase